MSPVRAADLAAGYEALRTQAQGGLAAESPLGLAVVLTQGLPAWMQACAAPGTVPLPPVPVAASAGTGLGAEVVRLLTEMVLGGGRRLAVS